MYTVSDIVADVNRGILAHNMAENMFSYRIIFYINENGIGTKHYVDTLYNGVQKSLEDIIRRNLSVTNSIAIAEITTLKNGKCIRLLSRSYSFSLDGYFKQISGGRENGNRCGKFMYGRYAIR